MAGLLVVLAAATAAAQTRTFDAVVSEAARARAAGDVARTAALLREAYALRPVPALMNNLGRTLEEAGEYAEAADCYRKVLDAPDAPPDLKALDRSRIAGLQEKLGHAWLKVAAPPRSIDAFLDGRPVSGEARSETGRHVVEVLHGASRRLRLWFIDLPADRRTTVDADFAGPDADQARIALDGLTRASVRVDGYLPSSQPGSFDRVLVAPGRYRVEAVVDGIGRPPVDLEVTAGQDVALSSVVGWAVVPGPAPSDRTGPDGPVRAVAPPGPWPWVVTGSGIAAAGLGVGLVVWGALDRSRVTNASTNAQGVVTGVTYSQARSLESSGNAKTVAGAVLTAAGLAAVAGGVAWALLAPGNAPPPRASVAVGPGAVVLQGAF